MLRSIKQDLLASTRDVYLCAVLRQGCGGHEPETGATAGNYPTSSVGSDLGVHTYSELDVPITTQPLISNS